MRDGEIDPAVEMAYGAEINEHEERHARKALEMFLGLIGIESQQDVLGDALCMMAMSRWFNVLYSRDHLYDSSGQLTSRDEYEALMKQRENVITGLFFRLNELGLVEAADEQAQRAAARQFLLNPQVLAFGEAYLSDYRGFMIALKKKYGIE